MINPRIEEYVEEICSYIKFKKVHTEIKLEILDHIQEKTEELMLNGLSKEEALKKALDEIGQAELIGRPLNQSHKASAEWGLLSMTIVFSLLGIVIAYLIVANKVINYSTPFYNSVVFNIIGYIFLIGLYFFDYKKLEKHSLRIFIGIILILFLQMIIAAPINGKRAWIPLGSFTVNIVDLTLFLFPISLSKLIRIINLRRYREYIYLSLMLVVPFMQYIMLGSFMEAFIYFVLFIVLMLNSKVRLGYIFSTISLFFVVCTYTIASQPYRIKRLLIFMNPEKDPKGSGFINIQIQNLLSSAGLKGKGFTFPGTLPEVHTDLILTYIIYTFGWVAGIMLIGLVLSFIVRMFVAAGEVKDAYGRLLIQGFLCIFTIEFVWNILMIFGLVPIVSMGMPFISYGSSMVLTHMAAVGIMISIYRCKNLSFVS
ncbi:FtsW/RodA/SpoVE family cell cycle protein [Clostridium paridis]|uniref:FtsW/RodA/SpoVE family cell cycle protein n=1 Tax=Clostridium paridis TaxID=2803863 RepID=A0A937FIK4_9CLOT|nr:FtsW/RodA/SpoVE family cell cycle protein [Clostridium paridis]